ncbi:hypothetical protein [Actinoplanes couchii]|uniref:Uncharacterized protein n=1 Tax=Actinoplanes couchii TaxID=403638 RepID=A0ABQ3XK75_9ACTN|nr:hypothetical protein [Actinoplanes couchii]MDR6320492.1 hypothetical protein [Actinoplanes couchii]GID58896.1 hypothetical protein Aco03nite_073000 [Actinoplanes couchii]
MLSVLRRWSLLAGFVTAGFTLIAAAFAVAAIGPAPQLRSAVALIPMAALVVLLTCGQMLILPVAGDIAARLAGERHLGAHLGALATAGGVGVLVTRPVVGRLLEHEPVAPWALLAGLAALAALMMWGIQAPAGRDPGLMTTLLSDCSKELFSCLSGCSKVFEEAVMAEVSALIGVDRAMRIVRMTGTALVTGVAGGTVTAALTLLMARDVAPVALILGIVVPGLLAALIAGRIVLPGEALADRWIVAAGGAGALLIAVSQAAATDTAVTLSDLASGVAIAVVYGSVYGLIAAVPAIAVLVPVVLLLWARVTWRVLQSVVVVAVMAWTAAFTLLLGTETNIPATLLACTAAVLAGIGAVHATRPAS